MHLLRLLAEVVPVEPSVGHIFYDVGLGIGFALLGGAKIVETAKDWGLIPDKRNGNGNGNVKYMYNKLDDIVEKMDKQIALSIEMVTILKMRRRDD